MCCCLMISLLSVHLRLSILPEWWKHYLVRYCCAPETADGKYSSIQANIKKKSCIAIENYKRSLWKHISMD